MEGHVSAGTPLPAASSQRALPSGDPGFAGIRPGAAGLVGARPAAHSARAALAVARDYLALTKPRIISLLLLTTVTTMIVADPSGVSVVTILWTMLGGYLAAGGAGAINHYVERDRDARMDRTCDRPIASGRIRPGAGLAFGIALGALATAELALAVNPLAAALALAGLLGYVFVYTLWLKPRTPQNIVIGGAAGAVPPLVGWAAATGAVGLDALYPFAIVFLWTPPHFWALALLVSDDYARVGVPMLPVARGEAATRRLIVGYTLGLVAFTTLPYFTGLFGAVYLACALALGAAFTALAAALAVRPNRAWALRLHLASLAYLALLFAAMAVDRLV
jgi:heme o synthase